jgi:hypothetical protein
MGIVLIERSRMAYFSSILLFLEPISAVHPQGKIRKIWKKYWHVPDETQALKSKTAGEMTQGQGGRKMLKDFLLHGDSAQSMRLTGTDPTLLTQ